VINSEQIKEWVDNPVTEALYWLCSRELSNVREVKAADCLYPGEPQKTQENLLINNTKEFEWQVFLNLLKGKFKEELGGLETYHKLVEDEDEAREEDGTE